MQHHLIRRILITAFATAALLSITSLATKANAQATIDKALPANTRFFVPRPGSGSIQQAVGLLEKFQLKNALLIAAMEATPQAVWLTGNTPAQTASTV